MKKLLAVVMVLGVASVASATTLTLSLTVGGSSDVALGGPYTVDVMADNVINWITNMDVVTGGTNVLSLGGGQGWQVGDPLTHKHGTVGAILIDDAQFSQTGETAADTVLYTLTLMANEIGTVDLADVQGVRDPGGSGFPPPNYDIATAPLNIIPEPISMVLLGLGGLALRRRR